MKELGAINAKPGDMIFELAITKGKTKHTTFFLVRSDYSTAIVLAD